MIQGQMGKKWKQWHFIFLGSKITMDGDCCHEIKRHLLLGRKAMTNLDRILKSRDITLQTKVHRVKAMVFPVAKWKLNHKKGWAPKNWCFQTMVLKKTLESSINWKEIKPVNPKGSQFWIFIGGTDLKLKLQYFGHLIQTANSLEKTLMLGKTERRRERGWQRMRLHHWINGHEFEQALGDGKRQESLACCSPLGQRELNATQQLNNSSLS